MKIEVFYYMINANISVGKKSKKLSLLNGYIQYTDNNDGLLILVTYMNITEH